MFIRGDTGKLMENGEFDIRDSKNDDESNESNEYNLNIPNSYDILKSLMGENINKKKHHSYPNIMVYLETNLTCVLFSLRFIICLKVKLNSTTS